MPITHSSLLSRHVTIIIEQPTGARFRYSFNPINRSFAPTRKPSLLFKKRFSGAYGWIEGLGEPPNFHCDAILISDKQCFIEEKIPALVCGIIIRKDGDNKIITIDLRMTPPDDLNFFQLDRAIINEVRNIYSQHKRRDHWFGQIEALHYLSWLKATPSISLPAIFSLNRQTPKSISEVEIFSNERPYFSIAVSKHFRFGVLIDFHPPIQFVKSNSFLLHNTNCTLNISKIVNTFFYILRRGKHYDNFFEFNPNTVILSSKNCFWHTLEIEYKIDLPPNPHLYNVFFPIYVPGFEIGNVCEQISFEKYIRVSSKTKTSHFVILGKSNWPKKKAIKYKFKVKAKYLTHETHIIPYNNKNLRHVISTLSNNSQKFSITPLPVFYKWRRQAISIDKKDGFIFAINIDLAVPLNHCKSVLLQVEVEYWSQLLSTNSFIKAKANIKKRDICLRRLIHGVNQHLNQFFTSRKQNGLDKFNWILSIHEANLKNKKY